MDLKDKATSLNDWMRAARYRREDYAIGVGLDALHVYMRKDEKSFTGWFPTVWKGTPVEWHFGVGQFKALAQ